MDCIEMTCKVWLDCIQQNDICLHGIHISILYKWSASLNRWDVTIECDNYDETFQFVRCNYVEKSICLLIQIDLIWPNIRIQHAISKCANVTQIGIASYRTKWPCTLYIHCTGWMSEEKKKKIEQRCGDLAEGKHGTSTTLHCICTVLWLSQSHRINGVTWWNWNKSANQRKTTTMATSIASTDVVVVVDDIDRRTKRYANELNQVLASSGVNNTNILIKIANA